MLEQCCSKCGETKLASAFVFDKRYNRPKRKCRACDSKTFKEWYKRNLEYSYQRAKDYRQNNPEFRKEQSRRKLKRQHLYQTKRNASEAKRRSKKLNATPQWLTEEHLSEMENLYWLAADLRAVSGEEYHVDHIVPLQGKNVCGLHVPWNLQILPSDMNLQKSNRHKET